MASLQPSTSKPKNNNLEGFGKESYYLLHNILQEIVTEDHKAVLKEGAPLRAQRYTGFHMDMIKNLIKDKVIVDKLREFDRRCVYDTLMLFYLDQQIMPTSTELFDSLQEFLPPYEDIRSFRKKLVKMGYIFKNVKKYMNDNSMFSKFVVYEIPSIRFERFLYLKSNMQFRRDERHIYYLSEVAIDFNKVRNYEEYMSNPGQSVPSLHFFAVSSINGIQFSKKVLHFDKCTFNTWLLSDVMPKLEVNSVVILDNAEHHCDMHCKTPNINSSDDLMTKWLTFHEIPFSETMNTIELYMLAEKYTDLNVRLNKPDIWLRQNGHDVLRLPDCINRMTPATHVHHLIYEILGTKNKEDILSDLEGTELNTYNLILAEEETRLYDLESKLDEILDHLKPSNNIETDLNLPTLSDSE